MVCRLFRSVGPARWGGRDMPTGSALQPCFIAALSSSHVTGGRSSILEPSHSSILEPSAACLDESDETTRAVGTARGGRGQHLVLLLLRLLKLGAKGKAYSRWGTFAAGTRAACLLCMLRKVWLLILTTKQQSKQASGRTCGSGGSIRLSSCKEIIISGVTLPRPQ
jgi:hypothetical protein